VSTQRTSHNGVTHPGAAPARDPPPLTTQLAFAKRELAMARVEAQPNWWLADQHQTPEQWAYRLTCLEAICATLTRCCEGDRPRREEHQQPRQGVQETATPEDARVQKPSRRARIPPNAWTSRRRPRVKHEPRNDAP
jgi:hypothetical protein